MTPKVFLTSTIATALFVLAASAAEAQTPTFSNFNDAAPGGCYEVAGTAPDPANPNLLRIAWVGCSASAPNGNALLMDTFKFVVEAPEGYFVSRISFSQSGTSGGSRGGSGFIGVSWIVDQKALSGTGSHDISLHRKTRVPVTLTTFLAAFGIQVVSGYAAASNPAVLVELAPFQ